MSSTKKRTKSKTKSKAKAKTKVIETPDTSMEGLAVAIEELFWQNPIVYSELCDCCMKWPCTVPLDPETRKILVKKGFIGEKSSIISPEAFKITYEAMTGRKPPWPE